MFGAYTANILILKNTQQSCRAVWCFRLNECSLEYFITIYRQYKRHVVTYIFYVSIIWMHTFVRVSVRALFHCVLLFLWFVLTSSFAPRSSVSLLFITINNMRVVLAPEQLCFFNSPAGCELWPQPEGLQQCPLSAKATQTFHSLLSVLR